MSKRRDAATPAVSVLMPAYNAAAYLPAAIESILAQSFEDLELIVVDDGSTDDTPEILAACADPRLVRLRQPRNRGYVPALARARTAARGRYLARQDADDLSLPGRLAAQVAFLDASSEVVLVGTAYRTIDGEGRRLATYWPPTSDTAIRWRMLFHNAFVHSSVMLRREVLERADLGYDETTVPAEDYALWSRLLEHGRGANLPEPLVCHRRHAGQISERKGPLQRAHADRVSRDNLRRLGIEVDDAEVRVLRSWMSATPRPWDRSEMACFARTGAILAAFSRAPGIDRREAGRIRRAWVRRTVSRVPARSLGDCWVSGLLPAAFTAAPFTALAALAHQPSRRLVLRLRRTARHSPLVA